MAEAVHILIIDDHPLFRKSLRSVLSTDPRFVVCGEAETVQQALDLSGDAKPAIILFDLCLQGELCMDEIATIRERLPDCKVIVLSAFDESSFAPRCIKAGASGYVQKGEPPAALLSALSQVASGETYLSPQLRNFLLQPSVVPGMDTLSNREVQIFWLYGQGFSTQDIANKMQRSFKTIQAHRENIKEKLQLTDANEFTNAAMRWCSEVVK